jgi:hypothetical protein
VRHDRGRCGPLTIEEAERIATSCRDGSGTLFEDLKRQLVSGANLVAPVFTVRRRDVTSDQGRLIFESPIDAIVGPVESGPGWDVLQILALGDGHRTGEDARNEVFAVWLTARRKTAKIERHWGRGELPGDDSALGAAG